MAQFVYITENYRVNLECIFSLEKREILNPQYTQYINNYEKAIEDMKQSDNIATLVKNQLENIDEDTIVKDLYKLLREKIGEQPEQYLYEYNIILSTGTKVQVSKSKYEYINDAIDNLIESQDDDEILDPVDPI